MVPPIRAAAILSRKEEIMATKTSRTAGPIQPVGRIFRQDLGNTAFLEDLGEDAETEQQAEEVEDNRPFALAHAACP